MAENFDEVRAIARAGAPDRYLAALLAPRSARDDLIALAAFVSEIEKIAQVVSDPHLGEIRVQWWRDALLGDAKFIASGHPIADAFAAVIARRALPRDAIGDFLDAHVHGLYADAPDTQESFLLSLELKEGVVFQCAARCLGATDAMCDAAHATFKGAAIAYGSTRTALGLPYALERGRMPLPPVLAPKNDDAAAWRISLQALCADARTHLAHVSDAYPAQPAAIKTALLPLALVEPYLRALSDGAHDPRRDIADIAPLTRTWRLAKTHMRGRLR